MRYDPATYVRAPPWANRGGGHARHQPVSTVQLAVPDRAISRQAAELDVWEDEGGTTAGEAPEVPRAKPGRHFDEFSG